MVMVPVAAVVNGTYTSIGILLLCHGSKSSIYMVEDPKTFIVASVDMLIFTFLIAL